jgi:oligopeptide/dipeptide ABC transporter ATP-binding protein
MTVPLLELRDVTIALRGSNRRMVTGVGLSVSVGEVFGVVGESGSGKTLLTRTVFGLQDDTYLAGGTVSFAGRTLPLDGYMKAARKLLGGEVGFVPQDPYSSLNPTMRVGEQITEALYLAKRMPMNGTATRQAAIDVLGEVGIPEPELAFRQFPDQFSGGMRQRIVFAIALAQDPKLLIADEPTTALDAITQRRVIELMLDRCRTRGMAVILISHNLELLRQSVDRLAVLYGGQLHNIAETAAIGHHTIHPYTEALFDCIPSKGKTLEDIRAIRGEPAGAGFGLKGCAFASRCRYAEPICVESDLPLNSAAQNGFTACLLGRGAPQ